MIREEDFEEIIDKISKELAIIFFEKINTLNEINTVDKSKIAITILNIFTISSFLSILDVLKIYNLKELNKKNTLKFRSELTNLFLNKNENDIKKGLEFINESLK